MYNVPHSVDTQFNRLIGCQKVRPPLYGQYQFGSPHVQKTVMKRSTLIQGMKSERQELPLREFLISLRDH